MIETIVEEWDTGVRDIARHRIHLNPNWVVRVDVTDDTHLKVWYTYGTAQAVSVTAIFDSVHERDRWLRVITEKLRPA